MSRIKEKIKKFIKAESNKVAFWELVGVILSIILSFIFALLWQIDYVRWTIKIYVFIATSYWYVILDNFIWYFNILCIFLGKKKEDFEDVVFTNTEMLLYTIAFFLVIYAILEILQQLISIFRYFRNQRKKKAK